MCSINRRRIRLDKAVSFLEAINGARLLAAKAVSWQNHCSIGSYPAWAK